MPAPSPTEAAHVASRRVGVTVRGAVQGVGFRPFVHRTASRLALCGFVRNAPDAVRLEVEGAPEAVASFLDALRHRPPPAARLDQIVVVELAPAFELAADAGFAIRPSEPGAAPRPVLPPDLATCAACLEEVADPAERRHDYPFTNCTACGPRYTIVAGLPYDRPRTSMAGFPLCEDCRREYEDLGDRRYHAQPVACPRCGPQLRLLGADGAEQAAGAAALAGLVEALRAGRIVALQGLGGFQLLVDARDEEAVARLRRRKRREAKPFALLARDVAAARLLAEVSDAEAEALRSSAAPILLLDRGSPVDGERAGLAPSVAPGSPVLGIMLPCTPLHHLLARRFAGPLVCTSGNVSQEPMCIDPEIAVERLGGIADVFCVHDRPILRPVDDSVGRIEGGELRLLRRARGFVPRPLALVSGGPTVLAVGGHRKGAVALGLDDQVVLSQHLGDLDTAPARALLERTIDDLVAFFGARVDAIACDLHPDYASTRVAERLAQTWRLPRVGVQHHHAHVASALAEQGLDGAPALGLAWDGTGYGPDGTVWGGEALIVRGSGYERFAHLEPFPLPGGDRAVLEPPRAALGLLVATVGAERAREVASEWFAPRELAVLLGLAESGFCAPRTSSIGRLFDAVAALAGVCRAPSFEGQAAMALEYAMGAGAPWKRVSPYPLPLSVATEPPHQARLGPLVEALLEDLGCGAPAGHVSARLHAGLAVLAREVADRAGQPVVALSGGCFQNRALLRATRARLVDGGYRVVEHGEVPPNDGGLALGQLVVARGILAATPEGGIRG